MLLIEGLRSLQRPTYLQTPIGGHHHQLRSLDLVGQLTTICLSYLTLGVFIRMNKMGLIPPDMEAQLNFIPMATVISAYAGQSLGFGVILGLLAAEKMPVNIRCSGYRLLETIYNHTSNSIHGQLSLILILSKVNYF